MASSPTPRAILSLYASTLRTSRAFSSYNFREYFLRRTKYVFRAMQAEKEPQRVGAMYAEALKDLSALRRSVVVNQLYGGSRLVVEEQGTRLRSNHN